MSDGFASPASSGGLDYEAAKGHLLMVEPLLYEPSIPTTFGDNPAVRCNVVDLTDQTFIEDTLIFPKMLVSALRSRIGSKVLATLDQGAIRKPGQNPPWIFVDQSANPQAVSLAKAWIAANSGGQFSAPAASAGASAAATAKANTDHLTSIFGAKAVDQAPPF